MVKQYKRLMNKYEGNFFCPEIPNNLQHHLSVFESQCSDLHNQYSKFKFN